MELYFTSGGWTSYYSNISVYVTPSAAFLNVAPCVAKWKPISTGTTPNTIYCANTMLNARWVTFYRPNTALYFQLSLMEMQVLRSAPGLCSACGAPELASLTGGSAFPAVYSGRGVALVYDSTLRPSGANLGAWATSASMNWIQVGWEPRLCSCKGPS